MPPPPTKQPKEVLLERLLLIPLLFFFNLLVGYDTLFCFSSPHTDELCTSPIYLFHIVTFFNRGVFILWVCSGPPRHCSSSSTSTSEGFKLNDGVVSSLSEPACVLQSLFGTQR